MQRRQGLVEVGWSHKLAGTHILNLFHRKLTKRLEDLTQDSGALKSHLLPQLKALNNLIPELVNFGISVRVSENWSYLVTESSLHSARSTNHAPPQ